MRSASGARIVRPSAWDDLIVASAVTRWKARKARSETTALRAALRARRSGRWPLQGASDTLDPAVLTAIIASERLCVACLADKARVGLQPVHDFLHRLAETMTIGRARARCPSCGRFSTIHWIE